jgi:hypothetical protein
MHRVARPFFASRAAISYSEVVSTRAPDAPIGWPMAIAPPLTLTLPRSQPSSLPTASAWAAKGLVGFDQIEVGDDQPAFLQRALGGGTGRCP